MAQKYIIFIAIILILLIGGVLVWQRGDGTDGNIPPTPPPPTGDGTPPTITPPPSDGNTETLEGWETYRNEELGFELAYPGEWFVYDKAKWEEDNKNGQCNKVVGETLPTKLVVINREDLGICVGDWAPVEGLRGEFILRVGEEFDPFPEVWRGEGFTFTDISGVKAAKYPFTEKTKFARARATVIFVNHNTKGYTIEFLQIDNKGNYDPIYDQILSTFRFLE